MVVHEYLKLFVFRRRMVTYEYFMDDMQEWEISLLADNVNSALRDEWEMTRWIVYTTIQPHIKQSQRDKPIHELMPLPFDEENEEHNKEMTNKQRDILRQRAEHLKQKMFNKKKFNTN